MSMILISTGDNIPENLFEVIKLSGLNEIYESNNNAEWVISLYRQDIEDPSQVCTIIACFSATKEFISISVDPETKVILNELMHSTTPAFEVILERILKLQIQNALLNSGYKIYANCHREYEEAHPHVDGLFVNACGYDTYGKFGYEMYDGLHIDHFRAIMAGCDCHAFKQITSIYDAERYGHEKARRAWINEGDYWVGTYSLN